MPRTGETGFPVPGGSAGGFAICENCRIISNTGEGFRTYAAACSVL
jgi:hypothetical protein